MSASPLPLLASASLLLAPPALAQKTPDVRVDLGDLAGSAASFKSALAVEGSSVYVVWADYRNTPFLRGDIYFNRSPDAGRTWLASAARLDRGSLPGADCSTNPDLAVLDGTVYAVWMDTRGLAGRVYFNRSFDGGQTWCRLRWTPSRRRSWAAPPASPARARPASPSRSRTTPRSSATLRTADPT